MPAPVHPAATVLLLREDDGPAGYSVFMVRRSMKSSFMPGAYVFPGGRVDPEDADADVLVDDAVLHARFPDLPPDMGRAHLIAAVREVEEEALIRLPDPGALETWSRWVTPTIERKRFDAWFFVARLPENAVPTHDDHEVTASAWVDPIDALARYGDGEMIFAPPTWYTLWDLARYAGVDAVIAEGARRHVRPVMPRFEEIEGEMVILLPGDTLYPDENGVDGPTRLVMRGDGRWWAVGQAG